MNESNYKKIISKLNEKNVTLIAVSKSQHINDVYKIYSEGHRDFGENYVQELLQKHEALPKDIRWHFIGHLQSNKVKFIAPFIYMIQSVDSEKLLLEINKQGKRNNKIINCLLQIYIAKEETKYGLNFDEAELLLKKSEFLENVSIIGFMGMASNTEDNSLIENEFAALNSFFKAIRNKYTKADIKILSMGMSADFGLAIKNGSNLVRIGSLIFGSRIK
jgi:PLP dependent protein